MSSPQLTPAMESALMAFAQQQSGIIPMLRNFFTFLHTRTDFYMVDPNPKRAAGFAPGEAEALVLKVFRSLPYRDAAGKVMAAEAAPAAPARPAHAAESGPSRAAPKDGNKTPAAVSSPTAEQSTPVPAPAPTQPPAPAAAPAAASASPAAATAVPATGTTTRPPYAFPEAAGPKIQTTDDGLQVPVANGGAGPGYWWQQTAEEVTLSLALLTAPPDVRGKDLRVTVEKAQLKVSLVSATNTSGSSDSPRARPRLLCAAPLTGAVSREAVWGVETGADAQATLRSRPADPLQPWVTPDGLTAPPPVLSVTLQKSASEAGGFWPRPFTRLTLWGQVGGGVCEGAEEEVAGDFSGDALPCITLAAVDNSRSILEYDEETQAAIRRAVFDGNRSAAGLPTSAQMLAAEAEAAALPPAGGAPPAPPLPPQQP